MTGNVLQTQAYAYNAAMNRVSVQNGNSITTESSNNLNQLTGTTGGGLMRFAGTVSKPATVTVGGNAATVRSDDTFEGWASVSATGTTSVPIVATDTSGNVTTKHATVTPAAVTGQSFSYDADGNQTAAGMIGSQVTYGWDAANRLTTITQGSNVTTFDYDGLSRRTRESLNGAEVRHWIWGGSTLAEERSPTNAVTKRFFPQGEQINGTPYFYTRDHLGSVREMVDASGAVHARYSYDPYGVRSANLITSNPVEADFGFTGHYFHHPSGLHLALYRAYNSQIGRWANRDPSGERGGVNLYGYANGDPIDWYDSDGEGPVPAPQAPDGTPLAPPWNLPPGHSWKPQEPQQGNRQRWYPSPPVPNPGGKGAQPNCSWDPLGHWDHKDGSGNTDRKLPDGTPVDHWNNPLPTSPPASPTPAPPNTSPQLPWWWPIIIFPIVFPDPLPA